MKKEKWQKANGIQSQADMPTIHREEGSNLPSLFVRYAFFLSFNIFVMIAIFCFLATNALELMQRNIGV